MILDIGIGQIDGLEVLRQVRLTNQQPSYHHDYGVGIPRTRREGHRVGSPNLPAQAIRCGPASANYGSMVPTCMTRIPRIQCVH